MKLSMLDDLYAVCQLPFQAKIPDWLNDSGFSNITRTQEELSIVCLQKYIPSNLKIESGWRIIKVEGTLPFELTGILSSIILPLANSKISIFSISTFNTDYILVKKENLDLALQTLRIAGFEISN